ncbi:cysteine protease ATG4B [Tribolium castaneum]|uniref:Cysteine protease n=1 Tax=Tribolium castaneum TaxID=7070 RepID=D6WLQ9_TRICA|nr:PREDICTED: cysteine protease ATG4B [Tribolium castaneum]EFA03418.1 Cysteine protease ATG4B-like Protein [Tribolium castaneum]|eukprot:XP_972923.1 PREDICTED: cysteine protease ATG4B [Tribolium castaneum]
MDGMFELYLDGSIEPDDIPHTADPVYILGKKYNALQELDTIRQDILSKIWFTYRKNFVPIGGDEGLTTDKGWGCMLRCGQMVLAQALVTLHLGRDWVWEPETKDSTYLKILSKFVDKRQAPFSIHQIAMMGVSENKEVGQWFGPNTVAQVLKKLVKYDEWSAIEMHIALDNTLIISDIRELCLSQGSDGCSSGDWKPLLLIVPLRLGLQEINPIYASGLKKCFQFKQSLGVIGGKPNLALYFIGHVGDEVIYLDPHTTQKSGSVESKETEEEIELDSTYHCKYASRINILSMDPSVAVCFFCNTEGEFNDLCHSIKKDLIEPEKQPLFEITYEKPKQWTPTLDDAVEAADFELSGEYDSEHEFEIL